MNHKCAKVGRPEAFAALGGKKIGPPGPIVSAAYVRYPSCCPKQQSESSETALQF